MASLTRTAVLLAALATLPGCAGFAPVTASPTRSVTRRPDPTTQSSAPAAPRALRVVGMGDSVMAGTSCGCRGLAEEYGDALSVRTHRRVHVDNLGSNGAVTADVLHDLAGRRTRDLVLRADVVVLTVGANDLNPQLDDWRTSGCHGRCFRRPAREMGRTLRRALHALRLARGGDIGHVLVTDYWNVFRDGQVALDTDGLGPFKGSGRDPTPLLADDGDHPNRAGMRTIVGALMRATPTDL